MTSTARKSVFIIDSPRRLLSGTTMRVWLDLIVGVHPFERGPGPHPAGSAQVMDDGRLAVWLMETTEAGRDARALVADDMVDITVEGDPPAVWLRP